MNQLLNIVYQLRNFKPSEQERFKTKKYRTWPLIAWLGISQFVGMESCLFLPIGNKILNAIGIAIITAVIISTPVKIFSIIDYHRLNPFKGRERSQS